MSSLGGGPERERLRTNGEFCWSTQGKGGRKSIVPKGTILEDAASQSQGDIFPLTDSPLVRGEKRRREAIFLLVIMTTQYGNRAVTEMGRKRIRGGGLYPLWRQKKKQSRASNKETLFKGHQVSAGKEERGPP